MISKSDAVKNQDAHLSCIRTTEDQAFRRGEWLLGSVIMQWSDDY